MDWSQELLTSLIWLGKTFFFSLIGLALTTLALSRFTVWGRQFRQITWEYFSPSRSWIPAIWIVVIVFMTLFSVRMNVLFSFWYNDFYSAMQALNAKAFWFSLIVFASLATIHVARELLDYYLRQHFLIRWRMWLTDKLMDRWLSHQTYLRSQYAADSPDNPDQRIQQDVDNFVRISLLLSMGFLSSVVSLFAFSIILWGLSGTLAIAGWEIPRAMVFLVYIYVIVATVFALKIGRPLIGLSFLNERFNASFRYALIRLHEYGESIAFFGGEIVERRNLANRFADVISNAWKTVYRTLKLKGLNLGISQAAVVFPFIVQAPRLLSKQITLGDVIQTSEAFDQVSTALSFFRSSYEDFAGYRAVINRLSGFIDAIDATEQLPRARIEQGEHRLALEALTVKTPAQVTLVENLNLALPQGSAVLIRGRSGIGKTTLLRAIAGLWPHVDGTVIRPLGTQSLFLPQKPYMPIGTLREALYYPGSGSAVADDQAAIDALQQCQLGHLVGQLDKEDDWSRVLSLGEQQRLAVGRVLLNQPQVLFLDEASSAMDEGLEFAMYKLLKQTLPDAVLVSVGHRSSLVEFHTHELELLGQGAWRLQPL